MRALPRTLSRSCINMEMQRRPLPERFLVVEVDSTVELPSEPDPGSAGSSLAFGMSRHRIIVRGTFAELA